MVKLEVLKFLIEDSTRPIALGQFKTSTLKPDSSLNTASTQAAQIARDSSQFFIHAC